MNSFIDSKKNDNFSLLRGIDLKELLIEVDRYFLEYRDSLDLPEDVTFGIELEYEKVQRSDVDEFIKTNLHEWTSEKKES